MASSGGGTSVEMFKALGDPVRWEIIRQIAESGELACSILEDTLPVSKPTISYHTKILQQAGLIRTQRHGRNSFFLLRPDVLRSAIDALSDLVPALRRVEFGGVAPRPPRKAVRVVTDVLETAETHVDSVVSATPTW